MRLELWPKWCQKKPSSTHWYVANLPLISFCSSPLSKLPVFESLRWDVVWHVRHSALFALPAILARLSPAQRRTVALETVVTLSADRNGTVRSGVLEALGEVIYTFRKDVDGPPEALVHLFLGSKEDPSQTKDQHILTPLELFYSDPKRPLICAFNFPAVALTLGRRRWSELRETYLSLTTSLTCGVRRTLAASLGELAKIIGMDNTQKDLLSVWWLYIDSEDESVRTKALESLYDIIGVVGNEMGRSLVQGLLTRWDGDTFRGWRERETVLKNIVSWVNRIGLDSALVARGLLLKGLEDNVAAVREAAIVAVSFSFPFPCFCAPIVFPRSLRCGFYFHHSERSSMIFVITYDSWQPRRSIEDV